MSEYFEIAYAVAARRLCLFTGTGFSKALTEGNMPGWQELLEKVCEEHVENSDLKGALFPRGVENPLHLEEAAQTIQMDLNGQGKNLHEVIADLVKTIPATGKIDSVKKFFKTRTFRVVTTNYDKLSEGLAETGCQSLGPGLPVPRSNSRVKVFHVHGSIDCPSQMVVTSDDYFDFMHSETYFSRKLSTVLHENTVVILGYSLGDTNLKSILNEYSGFMRENIVGSSIFFVSRSPVEQPIIDYYAACYGIRVIDGIEVETFFKKLERQYPRAEETFEKSIEGLNGILNEGKKLNRNFLKMRESFSQMVSALGAQGESLDDPKVVNLFEQIVTEKKVLCGATNAWEQYEHLASWLANLGSLLVIKGLSLEGPYLDAVKFSMETMSNSMKRGYSWHAYTSWDSKWKTIHASNRAMIKKFINANSDAADALKIVSRG